MRPPFLISDEVISALADARPVVALDSTGIAHGLSRPRHHAAALEFERILRDEGVTPATVAVVDGVARIGLDDAGHARIADDTVATASVRDLAMLAATGASAATAVAATAHLAAMAGIRVLAAGGLGGVHRGPAGTLVESPDLGTLARTPITVVSPGIPSIFDLAATLGRLEALSVPVVGYRTRVFPRFWVGDSDSALEWSVDSPEQVVAIMRAHDHLGHEQGIVVVAPVSRDQQSNPADLDLARNTVRVAASIATAWSTREGA
ncbi:pseudouridine-5'-phosphate glycosidase [Marisediminicola senii]|uniref:pseudouridine-5'-phosphate glycosidase n=1 Tax=Marisediminicola senii TaxID=2711233 RepID=UPI0013EB339A|nr:pseudouridine-5'-phosphate glycosidase [Marisediminicola senii]